MSENIPESIPTSTSRHSQRPTKKRALGPASQQSAQLEALFANPTKEINTSSPSTTKPAHAVPEIVANVQGSSAGAGSGEFHVYKASRRREYERLRAMDEEVEKEEGDRKWEAEREERRKEEEEKLRRNREKREKAKARKGKGRGWKGGPVGGADGDQDGEGKEASGGAGVKKRLGPAKVAVGGENGRAAEAEEKADAQGGEGEEGGLTIHDDD